MEKAVIIKQAQELMELTSCDLSRIAALQETIIDVIEAGKVPRDESGKIEALATASVSFTSTLIKQLDALCLSLNHA